MTYEESVEERAAQRRSGAARPGLKIFIKFFRGLLALYFFVPILRRNGWQEISCAEAVQGRVTRAKSHSNQRAEEARRNRKPSNYSSSLPSSCVATTTEI